MNFGWLDISDNPIEELPKKLKGAKLIDVTKGFMIKAFINNFNDNLEIKDSFKGGKIKI